NASERGMWLRGFGGSGDVKATADASGTDYQSGGLALGIDGDLGDTATVGAAFGYTRTNGNTAAGHLDMDSFQAAAYGNWQDEGYYLSGMAGIGRHKTNARRQVVAGNLNAQAAAAYQSWTGTAAAETGRNFDLSHLTVTPFVGLAYTHLRSDAFTESGAGAGNLQVGVGRQNSLESSLGVRLSSDWKTVAGREIRPVVEAAHVHQHRDNVSRLDTRFDASPDNVFVIRGPELDRNRTRIGAGLTAQLSKTAYLNAGYNGDFAGSDRHHSIAVTFKMQW
ncbi:MAG TPA: autotransporter outer membrane beta-barrel domain-containing protein, partial [Rhodocyclaceae bacterium]